MNLAILTIFLILFIFPTIHSKAQTITFEETLIQQACQNTSDPNACMSHIHIQCHNNRHPLPILRSAIHGTINEVLRAMEKVSSFVPVNDDLREQSAIEDCKELLEHTVDELSWSMEEMGRIESGGFMRRDANVRTWMSAALTNQDTCLEGFHGTDGRLKHYLYPSMTQLTQLIGNLLEVYKRMHGVLPHKSYNNNDTSWIGIEEENLMHEDLRSMHADAVVALDGSGRYRSINEAVNNAPSHSGRRYVIFVKRGVYRENVELKKKKSNIMIVGEGMGVTVISGSRNFAQGWTTFRTATFAVSGQGFIARDITFRNTAGPQNHQAVALRVDSDRSAFYRCSIEGYQDTLYTHSLRQFYRECSIYGTIDFIFGNAQAVLQNCKIYTRKPLPYQKVTITAQGRKDPNQNTGLSIVNSFVYATYPTYLGRPWKAYSRTVYMESYLSDQVQAVGWLEWYGSFGLSTLFYGEYRNYGPGAGLGGRVRWPGYHVIKNEAVAEFFSVRRFIDGAGWLPMTGVPFTADLTK